MAAAVGEGPLIGVAVAHASRRPSFFPCLRFLSVPINPAAIQYHANRRCSTRPAAHTLRNPLGGVRREKRRRRRRFGIGWHCCLCAAYRRSQGEPDTWEEVASVCMTSCARLLAGSPPRGGRCLFHARPPPALAPARPADAATCTLALQCSPVQCRHSEIGWMQSASAQSKPAGTQRRVVQPPPPLVI